jgi:hypothetical protein
MKPKDKGSFAFRSGGALFALSVLLELSGITSPIPLVGAVWGVVWAGVYYLTYGALFFIVRFGFFMAGPWDCR